jgi:hypothetical protein
MKKLIFALAIFISTGAIAQSTMKEDVDIIQAKYGKSKKELMGAYMKLEGAQSDAFWKLYDQYEMERKALGQKKIQLLNEYAEHYGTLTNEKADELTKAMLANAMDYEKLFSKYYDKSKAVIGALNAAKFIQLEVYLQTSIRSEIQNAIPFIGEVDKTAPHKH